MFSTNLQQKVYNRYKYTKIQRNYQISRPLIGQKINMGKSYSRVEKETGIFSKVRHYPPIICRKTVYNAFIFSRLNYGSEIYINTTKKYISPVIVTQNKLLRILQFKNIRTPLKDLYREIKTMKLKDLHHCKIYTALSTDSLIPLTYCQKL